MRQTKEGRMMDERIIENESEMKEETLENLSDNKGDDDDEQ
jgi:hypothetical protein